MINKTLTLQEKYKIALQIREIENEKLKLKSVSKWTENIDIFMQGKVIVE